MSAALVVLFGPSACSVEERPADGSEVVSASVPGGAGVGGDRVSAVPREGATGSQADSVLAVVQAVFDGINQGDGSLIMDAFLADGRVGAIRRPGAPVSASTAQGMAAQIQEASADYVERMWNPVVEVSGSLASVWAPYDFYIDGEFSHCGVDLFQLVRGDSGWKIRDLVYTVLQPPACEMHPEGPPAG